MKPPPLFVITILYIKYPISIDNKKLIRTTFSCNILLPYKNILIKERQALNAKEISVLYPALPFISKDNGVGV